MEFDDTTPPYQGVTCMIKYNLYILHLTPMLKWDLCRISNSIESNEGRGRGLYDISDVIKDDGFAEEHARLIEEKKTHVDGWS